MQFFRDFRDYVPSIVASYLGIYIYICIYVFAYVDDISIFEYFMDLPFEDIQIYVCMRVGVT